MKIFRIALLIVISFQGIVNSQTEDSVIIRSIYSEALNDYTAYNNLRELCKNIGGRICGSPQSEKAVQWMQEKLELLNLDKVYLQNLFVRNWLRGEKEYGYFESDKSGKQEINVCALGTSIGTGPDGIYANVIEVKDFDDLKELGREKIEGKIIFYNNPMRQDFIVTFNAYGNAAGPRVRGAIEAAKYGASGILVRSLTQINDYSPHTGIMYYVDTVKKIPAFAISTIDAGMLSEKLKADPGLKIFLRSTCEEYPEKQSYNVIGEITGTEKPEEIILVSGHLDAWDNGEGAHDDGAGVMHAYEVLRIFRQLNITPKHTIRFVAFMDEEVAQRGGRKYHEIVKEKNEKHIAAIESDAGGFVPYGFSIDANDNVIDKINSYSDLFDDYGIHHFENGYGGVDINFLKKEDIPLIGLIVDSQRYFDYQHSQNDKFEIVNRREMQLGSASMTALVYLIDKYGL
jgi:hypothetical protein